MSRTISLIAALGASLVLAAPAAFGKGQPVESLEQALDAPNSYWQQGLGSAIENDPATEALMLRSEALGRAYQNDPKLFLGRQIDPATEAVMLRSKALGRAFQNDPNVLLQSEGPSAYGASALEVRKAIDDLSTGTRPDAFERAVASNTSAYGPSAQAVRKSIEAREQARSVDRYLDAHQRIPDSSGQVSSGPPLDVFERAVDSRDTGSLDRFFANDGRFQVKPVDEPTQVTVSSSGSEIEWPQIGIGLGIGILLMLGLMLAVRATRHPPLAH